MRQRLTASCTAAEWLHVSAAVGSSEGASRSTPTWRYVGQMNGAVLGECFHARVKNGANLTGRGRPSARRGTPADYGSRLGSGNSS